MSETSSISERIRALEGAGITDVFIKKKVPPYIPALGEHNTSLNSSSKSTKIYQNPAGFVPSQSSSSFNSSLSSPPNRQSEPEIDDKDEIVLVKRVTETPSKPPSIRSSSRNEYEIPRNRTPSIDSIENEINPRRDIDFRIGSLADDLIGAKKTLKRVSINRSDFDYNLNNSSSRPSIDLNPDDVSIQVPINIPVRPSSVSSNNSVFKHAKTDSLTIDQKFRYPSDLENISNINMFNPINSKRSSIQSNHTLINNDEGSRIRNESRKSSQSTIKAPLSSASSFSSGLNLDLNNTTTQNDMNNLNNTHTSSNSNHNRLLIFNSEHTKGMSQTIHTDHFSCWNCDSSLTGSRYILKDEHPYCIKCYEELFAHECEECHKKIGTDSKDLSYKDKHWHEKCFFCHVCKLPLVDKPFGSKNDSLYCGECYNQAFASRCDKCAQIFKPGMKKMEYKGQQFHETCFLCYSCNTAIGTKSFIPKDNKIYCVPCYENNYATKCTDCMKVISQGGVSYKNQPYHKECFVCTHCQQSLAGQRFTSREDHPYCSECFGKLFAKKCFACHKPITVNSDLNKAGGGKCHLPLCYFKLSIPTPGGVRWDSHYRCVEVINRLDRDKLNSFLIENDYSFLTISLSEKEKIEEFLLIMIAFFTASKLSQKSEKPSISLVVPCVVNIYLHLDAMTPKCKHFSNFVYKAQKNLVDRFGGIMFKLGIGSSLLDSNKISNFNDKIYMISTLLDPRHKDKWMLSLPMSTSLKESLLNLLKNEIIDFVLQENYLKNEPHNVASAGSSAQVASTIDELLPIEPPGKKIKFDLFSYTNQPPIMISEKKNELDRFVLELNTYLNEPNESLDCDLLDYWKINKTRFINLSKIAKDIFCIQATSAKIEQVFSVSGFLMRPHRSRFTYNNLANLMFLKCNKDYL